jgi:outer membrane protein OmpA-like peptidoglycan-associated protein
MPLLNHYLLVLILLVPMTASAFKYLTPLKDSIWTVESTRYLCRLKHEISGYGEGQILHEAGDVQRVTLDGLGYEFAVGKIIVASDPPTWRPGNKAKVLSEIKPARGEVIVAGALATDILAELSDGMLIGFKGILKESNHQPFDVYLSSAGFGAAYEDFKICEDRLLPANYTQIQRSRVQYPTGISVISGSGRTLLNKIVAYLLVDSTVKQVFIDGHTDSEGTLRENIALSERRAVTVTNYLINEGIPAARIVTRYHGEKYPVKGNAKARNRAINRRTTIRLSRALPAPDPIAQAPE